MSMDQEGLQVQLFQTPNSLKFQMLLIYMTDGSRVNVIWSTGTEGAQLIHSSTWWPTWNTGFAWRFEELYAFRGTESACSKCPMKLMEVYGNDVMSKERVAKWRSTFASSRQNTMDNNQSGWKIQMTIEVNTARSEELIQMHICVTVWCICWNCVAYHSGWVTAPSVYARW